VIFFGSRSLRFWSAAIHCRFLWGRAGREGCGLLRRFPRHVLPVLRAHDQPGGSVERVAGDPGTVVDRAHGLGSDFGKEHVEGVAPELGKRGRREVARARRIGYRGFLSVGTPKPGDATCASWLRSWHTSGQRRWRQSALPPARRGMSRRSFVGPQRDADFRSELRRKVPARRRGAAARCCSRSFGLAPARLLLKRPESGCSKRRASGAGWWSTSAAPTAS